MGRNRQDVTEAELSVLRVLWDLGLSTIRQITAEIYPAKSESDYATVKKLLSRLERKEIVRRDREQFAHRFEAILSRDDLLGRRLQVLADNLCGGSQIPMLMHLIRTDDISRQQQLKLRNLIVELSESNPKTKKKKRGK